MSHIMLTNMVLMLCFFSVIGAISGGVLFHMLNKILNNRDAFLKRLSNAKKYVANLKIKRTKKLIEELSAVKVLSNLTPKHVADLIQHIIKQSFYERDIIFNQGDPANEMYFIIDGCVEVVLHEDKNTKKRL